MAFSVLLKASVLGLLIQAAVTVTSSQPVQADDAFSAAITAYYRCLDAQVEAFIGTTASSDAVAQKAIDNCRSKERKVAAALGAAGVDVEAMMPAMRSDAYDHAFSHADQSLPVTR